MSLKTSPLVDVYTSSEGLSTFLHEHYRHLLHPDACYYDGVHVIEGIPRNTLMQDLDAVEPRFPPVEYEVWSTGAQTRCVRLRTWYRGALRTLTARRDISACFAALLNNHVQNN